MDPVTVVLCPSDVPFQVDHQVLKANAECFATKDRRAATGRIPLPSDLVVRTLTKSPICISLTTFAGFRALPSLAIYWCDRHGREEKLRRRGHHAHQALCPWFADLGHRILQESHCRFGSSRQYHGRGGYFWVSEPQDIDTLYHGTDKPGSPGRRLLVDIVLNRGGPSVVQGVDEHGNEIEVWCFKFWEDMSVVLHDILHDGVVTPPGVTDAR
jgi:hypothetical protein